MCNWRGSDIDMRAHVWHTKVERRAHHTTTHTTRMEKVCIIAKAVKQLLLRESLMERWAINPNREIMGGGFFEKLTLPDKFVNFVLFLDILAMFKVGCTIVLNELVLE